MSKYHNRFYPHHFQSIINSILFFCLPVCFPENKNIKMYRTKNLPVVLCGCETWSLTLRKEHRLRVLKSRVLRKIFGPKRDEITGEWRKLHNVELRDQYCSPYFIGWIIQSQWDGRGMWHAWEKAEMHIGIWWGHVRGRDHLLDLGVGGSVILKWISKKGDGGVSGIHLVQNRDS